VKYFQLKRSKFCREVKSFWYVVKQILIFYGSTVLVGLGLIVEVSRSHSDTSHSTELPWTSDQPVAETSTWKHNTNKRQKSIPPAGLSLQT